jgi:phosphatidate cytidylyltransferase
MLRQRVLTALVLIPLVLVAIFALPAPWFLVVIGIVMLAGTREYAPLAGFSSATAAYGLVITQLAILAALFVNSGAWVANALLFATLACAAWLLIFIRLFRYRPGDQPGAAYKGVSMLTALVSVTTGWCALGWLRMQPDGSWLLLLFLLTVWAADTGAYFAGMNFGKRKLAPALSPGKTRAGLIGGLVAAPLIALLAAAAMPLKPLAPVFLVLLSLVTALASVGGDLVISLHKRTSGCKDSGSLLPGHGGVLDRLDSLIAASPFFVLGLAYYGY